MNWLEVTAILVTGFVGSAEFGSVALVHPVIRKLDPNNQLIFEKGLLKTFGRIMPVGMTAAAVLATILAFQKPSILLIAAAVSLVVALVVTIFGNVPINVRTGHLPSGDAPEGFITMRRRWDIFQLTRGSLQLVGFILVTLGIALQ